MTTRSQKNKVLFTRFSNLFSTKVLNFDKKKGGHRPYNYRISFKKNNFKNGFIFYSRFGFIETLSHDKEIFFHFSNFDGKAEKLEVGTEVEYCVFNREKGGKISAEGVKVNIIRSPSPVC